MLQRNALGLICADLAILWLLILARLLTVSKGIGIGDRLGISQGDRLVVAVPVDLFPHQFSDGTDRQIGGAVIQQRIDRVAIYIGKGAGLAVYHHGESPAEAVRKSARTLHPYPECRSSPEWYGGRRW